MAYDDVDVNEVDYGEPEGDAEAADAPPATLSLSELLTHPNIADALDEKQRARLAEQVIEEYLIDKRSREPWERMTTEALKLAKLEADDKTFPWEGAANVVYPTIALASIQFGARMLPLFVRGRDIVHGKVLGEDPTGEKQEVADLAARKLSDILLERVPDWVEELDALLSNLPVTGTAFKKVWWNPVLRTVEARFVAADDLVVNQAAPSLARAPRITHLLRFYPNEVEEKVRAGLWRPCPLDPADAGSTAAEPVDDEDLVLTDDQAEEATDSAAAHLFAEQHGWWDLDGDGLAEPYVATVHVSRRKLVRLTPRFRPSDIVPGPKGILKIQARPAFIKYPFLQAVDGAFYDQGFGQLLGHTSQVINATINQLLDAGTLQNAGGGFYRSGLKMAGKSGGAVRIRPAQWHEAKTMSDDLRKDLLPSPHPQPSPVLMQLLEFIVTAQNQIASTTEALLGEIPPAGTPASSLLATIEQGQKVYSGIARRIWEAIKEEIRLIARLQAEEGGEAVWGDIDQDGEIDLVPVADPNEVTDFQRINKAKAYFEIPGVNPLVASRRMAEALGADNVDELIPEDQPPPPEVQQAERELNLKEQQLQHDRLLALEEKKAEIALKEAQAAKTLAEARAVDNQLTETLALVDQLEAELELSRDGGPNGSGVAGVADQPRNGVPQGAPGPGPGGPRPGPGGGANGAPVGGGNGAVHGGSGAPLPGPAAGA